MTGQLNELQINNLLLSQSIGHLGCVDGERPYIVPITYLYDGDYIYSQTCPGMKLNIMRNKPFVCFEVDTHTDMFNWQSVILWGKFEELIAKEAANARTPLFESIFQLMTPSTVHLHEHESISVLEDSHRCKPVIFRIKITEKSGRFRKTQYSLQKTLP